LTKIIISLYIDKNKKDLSNYKNIEALNEECIKHQILNDFKQYNYKIYFFEKAYNPSEDEFENLGEYISKIIGEWENIFKLIIDEYNRND
jgi:hypothetical protein